MAVKNTILLFFMLITVACGVGDHMPQTASSSGGELAVGEVSYQKDLVPIFKSRCAQCHNPSAPPAQGDWLDYNNAVSRKAALFQRIWIKRDMPLGGNITEQERELIARWANPKLNSSSPVIQNNNATTSETNLNIPLRKLRPVGDKGVIGNDPVSRGRYLARAGDCMSCHTPQVRGAFPGAGGRLLELPKFGKLFTPNITPDVETGIGSWSQEDFYQAMHNGIRKDGSYLYPAFPYPSFTKMSRREVNDIYAYLRTLKPEHNKVEVNQLHFPFSVRSSIAVWRALYFTPGTYVYDDTKSAELNRGKYLVMGPGHCSACHTPRNFMGATEKDNEFAGADVDNWYASNLRYSEKNGISQWTEGDLVNFLGTGAAEGKATVVGPMAEVVFESLQYLTLPDLKAIALYLKSISSPGYFDEKEKRADLNLSHGRTVYTINCAKCHRADGLGTPGAYPPFFQNPVINQDDSTNLINVLLLGIPLRNGYEAMPSFEDSLTSEEIAAVANFIRVTWGSASQSNVTAQDVDLKRRNLIGQTAPH
jgi:mono/diheme cytochrome c family protein